MELRKSRGLRRGLPLLQVSEVRTPSGKVLVRKGRLQALWGRGVQGERVPGCIRPGGLRILQRPEDGI